MELNLLLIGVIIWKEVQDVGKRKVKCVGSGNVKEWKKKKERD